MERENFKRFRRLVEIFLDALKERYRIYPSQINENDNYPDMRYRFHERGLGKWTMGIWATGEWSEYYDVESKNKITIFLIHDWTMDKFRPSSGDIVFEVPIDKHTYLKLMKIAFEVNEVRKNPIRTYYEIYTGEKETNPLFLYFRDCWLDKRLRWRIKLRYTIGPNILYLVIRFISLFDPRVEKVVIFDEPGTMPRYTFGFLATKKFSRKSDKEFERFYNLYSRFPERLSRKIGIDAVWNVSDWPEDINEKQLRTRLFKGIYIEHYEAED